MSWSHYVLYIYGTNREYAYTLVALCSVMFMSLNIFMTYFLFALFHHTTTNHNKSQQTTTNHNKSQQTTTNHNKSLHQNGNNVLPKAPRLIYMSCLLTTTDSQRDNLFSKVMVLLWTEIIFPNYILKWQLLLRCCFVSFNYDTWTLGCKLVLDVTLIARFMGQHGAHLGPTGPRWAPCWPHELCYLGLIYRYHLFVSASGSTKLLKWWNKIETAHVLKISCDTDFIYHILQYITTN